MSLVINAPAVEVRLAQEAAKHGVDAVDYAVQILSTHLEAPQDTPEANELPVYALSPAEWTKRFDAWVEGHSQRQPLPDEAFSRASFYEGHS